MEKLAGCHQTATCFQQNWLFDKNLFRPGDPLNPADERVNALSSVAFIGESDA
ncbi:hypothetical protein [Photobacterium sp. TLY01]|uniref:hypothetical protein n=1 Tax=Photobacterium sp. TLY01 TaxID=2907534 RepID=UPI001F1F05D8|nr:hypothetical protein [Photobacterium sp. TLY01]UIP27599.1 hypothetical protein LN341_13410 [Photobacterium sp. TLY01]